MSFILANTWNERGLQLQAIKNKCNSIINNLNLPEDDVRVKGMIHVRQFCNTIAFIPIKLQQNAEIPNKRPAILTSLDLANITDLSNMLTDLNKNAKTSFITMVQFALENCIVRIIEAILGVNPQRDFNQNANLIVGLSGISEAERKMELMMLPAWIRNTLHANGIHNRQNRTIVVDGESYIFERGQRISCGSWSHIFHAVFHSLSVVEEIFISDRISTIEQISAV